MSEHNVADIMRLPESSSDDEQDRLEAMAGNDPPPSSKRRRDFQKPIRSSKRKKLEDRPDLEAVSLKAQVPSPTSQYKEFEQLSQRSNSQSKKRPTFASRHKAKSTRNRPTIDLSDVKEEASPMKKARTFDSDDQFLEQEGSSEKPRPCAGLPEEDEFISSASTTATKLFTFEGTPEPDVLESNTQTLDSPPTSPEIVGVKDVQTDNPGQGLESKTTVCPVCQKDVDHANTSLVEKAPRLLSLKKQQDFCRRHRLIEAELLQKERNYPDIDWQVLGLERIPKQMSRLRRVLQHKTNCYYVDQLETNIENAKGNRKAIKEYLTEGVLDIAKAGYYGPKGTKIIMDHITSELSKDLSQIKKEKLVQSVGMGGYVTAVLVPELTLRLVMEDMGIKDEAKARKVLDESTEIGLLLNPDDDHIEQHVIE